MRRLRRRYTIPLGAALILILGFFVLPPTLRELARAPVSREDGRTHVWQYASPLPTPRTEVAGAAIGNEIYVIGGFGLGSVTDTVEKYDPSRDAWTTVKPLPAPLHHAAAVGYAGKLFVIGGYTGLATWNPEKTVYIYDPPSDSWSRGADMPTPRGALTAQVIDGVIYAVGGADRKSV